MVNPYLGIQMDVLDEKYCDMKTSWGRQENYFSNGMVVDGLHLSKYRENIQLGGHTDLQHFLECQEFPR